jgi:hypothetical protein
VHVRCRRGATVAEMAVALLVAGFAATIGAGLLVAAERRARRDGHNAVSNQTARDVLHALRGEIESARWESIALRGDTAIDLQSHVGLSVVCSTAASAIVLPPATSSRAEPFTLWRYPPEATDVVAVWDSSGTWRYATVDSVTSATGGCPTSGPFRPIADSVAGTPLTRIVVSPSVTSGATIGSPVRVYRGVRWMIYRGGDQHWWLGQRRCSPACGSAQPVAGPLAPPSDSGLRFEMWPDGRVVVTVRAESGEARAATIRGEFSVRGAPRASP